MEKLKFKMILQLMSIAMLLIWNSFETKAQIDCINCNEEPNPIVFHISIAPI